MTEGGEFGELEKQWCRRKARNLRSWEANNKETGRTTDTWINGVKVESWFQFVGHLESHYVAKEGR